MQITVIFYLVDRSADFYLEKMERGFTQIKRIFTD